MDVNFVVNLPAEQCKTLLTESIDRERYFPPYDFLYARKDIIGYLKGSAFRIRKRRHNMNSFAPLLYGEFLQEGNHTRIQGEFRMHPFIKPFEIFWFGFLIIFFVFNAIFVFPRVFSGEANLGHFMGLTIPILLVAFAVGLIKWGKSSGEPEKNYIISFLAHVYKLGNINNS